MALGPQDNPDYIRLPQVVPGIIQAPITVALPTAAIQNLGPFYVGNLPALVVDFRSFLNVQLCQLVVSFFNDDTLLTATTVYTMLCDNTHRSTAVIPVTGSFVRLSVSALGGGAANLSVQLFANGIGAGVRATQLQDLANIARGTTAAVAPSGTTIYGQASTAAGLWVASGGSFGVGLRLLVDQQLDNAVWTRVAEYAGAAVQGVAGQVALVAAPARLTLVNTNAAAQDMFGSLVPVG